MGGYTGNAPYPSVNQVEQLIAAGKISTAILPAADVVTANDPRIQAVERLCTEYDGQDPSADYVIYICGIITPN